MKFKKSSHGLPPKARLLVVCLSRSWGGLEQVAFSDALEAAKKAVPVRLLCYNDSPIHRFYLQSEEAKRFVVVETMEGKPRNHFDFGLRARLRKNIANGINVMHLHQPSLLSSVVPWIWNFKHVGLIVTRHIQSDHRKRDLYHRILYSRIDAMLVMSEALRENVLKTHAIPERRVRVVPLGLDFERFDSMRVDGRTLRVHWAGDSGRRLVGVVGRLDPAKGQKTFLQAAATLLRNWDREVSKCPPPLFVLVGEETRGGEQGFLAELYALVEEFHIQTSVVFAGFQPNIPQVMASLDLVVMPSREETFGLVAIEALAMGTPVIVSTGGSANEIVGANEEYGFKVRPEDAFALQKRIHQGLLEYSDLKARALLGQSKVREKYSKENRVKVHVELYARVVRRRSRLF